VNLAVVPLLLVFAAPALALDSDAERLAGELAPGFRRPLVRVHPLLDQRGPSQEPPAAWSAFLEALGARRNLEVWAPTRTVAQIKTAPGYTPAIQAGYQHLGTGYADYREVRLADAVTNLRTAVSTLVAARHHLVDRRSVARAQLTIGLAQLEAGDRVGADRSMRAALLFDPTLRLRAGYDRPDAVDALEHARAAIGEAQTRPREFTVVDRSRSVSLHGRVIDDRLEIAIHAAGTLSIETQPLGGDPAADGDRLAARVWACLPFGAAPRRPGHRPRVLVDAGFGYHAFLSAPVTFGNFGLGANLSWLVAPHLALDAQLSVANSGRDAAEDLRGDIASARAFAGPGYSASSKRLRGSVSLGLEAAYASAVVLTSSAACKYFDEDDHPPDELCDHQRQVDTGDPGLLIGAGLSVSGGVRLVDQVFLTLRVHLAHYLFDPADTELGLPVGGQVALGYRWE